MEELIIHIPRPTDSTDPPRLEYYREEVRCAHSGLLDAVGSDDYGLVYRMDRPPSRFSFSFKVGDDSNVQTYHYQRTLGSEVWCRMDPPVIDSVHPWNDDGSHVNDIYASISHLIPEGHYLPDTDVTGAETRSMLGATPLTDGRILFSFFHPRAARVYLTGDFNDWQHPGSPRPNPDEFIPMRRVRGYYDMPNLWLALISVPEPGREYEYGFYIQGGVALNGELRSERLAPDPMTRAYGRDHHTNRSRVITTSHYHWNDQDWRTPPVQKLIVYETSIYGMTQGTPGIDPRLQGTFAGMTALIRQGYFNNLGVTAIALMPTSEAPTLQGPQSLGYDPCGFASVERDFGSPDDFRELVDTAHQHQLAVIADLVFNHTSNSFNPLWGLIDNETEGGFYFSGSTPWGNRVATEREEIQNYLIDVGKLLLKEYHLDGFRFDATHSSWMSHIFLQRFAYEIREKGFKSDCLLIAENLPNEPDLNFAGYNGFTQWCDPFHDKIKALLREGVYQDWVTDDPHYLGDVFYFSKTFYASHTNNSLNYCESHDENSVPYEIATNDGHLIYDDVKARKAKLGLFATAVALGQPMLYMGQEFGTDRPRNLVLFDWPENPQENPFYAWTRRLFSLRRRHPGLRIYGYNPAEQGAFRWIIGPWMDGAHGSGKTVVGWRSTSLDEEPREEVAVLLNFETDPIMVDLELGIPGRWLKLADIDSVNDTPPEGGNHREDPTTLISNDGRHTSFTLPPSSGFIYMWSGA